jgi:hypothetical protein
MASEIDLLRQENTRLMAEMLSLRPSMTRLRMRLRGIRKARIDTVAENTRRDVEMPGVMRMLNLRLD